jgi:hypothetical protein
MRDLTSTFIRLRTELAATPAGFGTTTVDSHISSRLLSPAAAVEIPRDPAWLPLADEIRDGLALLKRQLDAVATAHAQNRVSVSFDASGDADLDRLTQAALNTMRTTHSRLSRLKALPEGTGIEDGPVRRNAHCAFVTQLHEQSRRLNALQSERASHQEASAASAPAFLPGDPLNLSLPTEPSPVMAMLAATGYDIRQREHSVNAIAQSINELADMTRDMAQLVSHQGSLIDRVDGNMTEALDHAIKGTEHLQKADKMSRKTQKLQNALLFFAVLAAVLFVLVIWKKTSS